MKNSSFTASDNDDDAWDDVSDEEAWEEDFISLSGSSEASSVEVIQLFESDLIETLKAGRVKEKGLLPYSSNTSFLVVIEDGQRSVPAVYKPRRGENPLWDFEWGTLCQRETAAYVISDALGWQLVPPTVLREGPHGIGSMQFYIDHDPNTHYFTVQADARFATPLRQLSLFDFMINNADRKSGHCLIGADQRLWAIDHGICFHTEYKLRTVIWEFSCEPIADDLLADLVNLRKQIKNRRSELTGILCPLLAENERTAMLARLDYLIRQQAYPSPHPNRRNYPWPPV